MKRLHLSLTQWIFVGLFVGFAIGILLPSWAPAI